MDGVGGHVCGELICAICNTEFGNEDEVYCCMSHSNGDAADPVDPVEMVNEVEIVTAVETAPGPEKKKRSKVASKAIKVSEYTAKDLLILSQAFVRTSENAIEGVARKSSKFWDDVVESFNQLKRKQEVYDMRLCNKEKYSKILLKGEFLSSNDDEEVEVIVPRRTASSLQQK